MTQLIKYCLLLISVFLNIITHGKEVRVSIVMPDDIPLERKQAITEKIKQTPKRLFSPSHLKNLHKGGNYL